MELATFTDAVRSALGGEGLPPGYAFADWSTALDFVAKAAGRRRLVVVLDEFPYLSGSSPGSKASCNAGGTKRASAAMSC